VDIAICPTREIYERYYPKLHEGTRITFLRGTKMGTKQALFDEFSAALQFPWYFGENWDALEECIHDLQWFPDEPQLFVLTNVERILPHSAKDRRILWEILTYQGNVEGRRHVALVFHSELKHADVISLFDADR
jgi:hypothetical protein